MVEPKTVLDESHHVRSLRIKVGPNSKKRAKNRLRRFSREPSCAAQAQVQTQTQTQTEEQAQTQAKQAETQAKT